MLAALPHALYDPLPAGLKARERLPAADRRAVGAAPPGEPRGGRGGPPPPRVRRAAASCRSGSRAAAARPSRRSRPRSASPRELVARYRALLPFELTDGQEQAIREIDADLARHRADAAAAAGRRRLRQDRRRALLAAPRGRARPPGRADGARPRRSPSSTSSPSRSRAARSACGSCCCTSSLPAKEHAAARAMLASGEAQIAVGTHALIQQAVEFADLAVAVVDEQHRFGVEQRKALAEGRSPHVLHMTATPIPRTLALTVYGDLARERDPEAAGQPQADRHRLGGRREELRGVRAAPQAPRRRAAGVRRVPADRGVGDVAGAGRRGGGRAAHPRRAEGATASGCCTAGCAPPSGAR